MELFEQKSNKNLRPYKQCPDCLAKMPVKAPRCPECGIKVGEMGADGKAKKPVDWKSYIISAIFILLFVWFVKWAFFS
ncbi:MAG: hypothetical protein SWH68_11445 [Thermodesulfobacteriota bacterium]|nr:hypothetical protein [Thermodesulfobacteriota bacterium]